MYLVAFEEANDAVASEQSILKEDYGLYIKVFSMLRYSYVQWNLIITVTLGPNLAGCYIEVAFLLSGIQNHHN